MANCQRANNQSASLLLSQSAGAATSPLDFEVDSIMRLLFINAAKIKSTQIGSPGNRNGTAFNFQSF